MRIPTEPEEVLPVSQSKPWIISAVCLVMIGLLYFGSSYLHNNHASEYPTEEAPLLPHSSTAPDLEVLEAKPQTEEYGRYIIGTVQNHSAFTYSYVQIDFNLYDKSGAQVGSAFANVNNLEPGKKWKFKAILADDNAATFKVKGVSGW